jgi:hypothetical protein
MTIDLKQIIETGKQNKADMELADQWEKEHKEELRQKRIEATAKIKAWFEKHEKGSKKDRKKNRKRNCINRSF